ncbi:MAG: flagellar basal-body rod protein FlgB [Devosia sp. 67-54]|uniref:flagellar basal body rod protein FlgB n=1 Tax=unclassified Devosia TaxID=196773 RepID=UPI00095D6DF5|nr:MULTISPECIES: flagellar basal body rod protein FlgB [unclassified Devosia]MBN9304024.1 flagellar basal body rod protein FlgB [Devosia sp.]OJX17866.1 MAG: flagellar basal-body rod protein FlgB [Devosia sp. 67-54]
MAGLGSIPLLQALTDKMRWHQSRQQVLAENIANADTPGYIERDLKPLSFDDQVQSVAQVSVARTSPMHISVSSAGDTGGFDAARETPFEITPSGNGVTLEDEMMKVAGNDMDYQTVTALYTRSMAILRTALGRSA